jgi:hypothetical protein
MEGKDYRSQNSESCTAYTFGWCCGSGAAAAVGESTQAKIARALTAAPAEVAKSAWVVDKDARGKSDASSGAMLRPCRRAWNLKRKRHCVCRCRST